MQIVSSYNGWDPLEEVIVGTAVGAARIAFEPGVSAYYPNHAERRKHGTPRTAADIDAAQAQLDNLAKVLEHQGVTVRRPTPMEFSQPVRTPTFSAESQNAAACPRDVLLVIGNEIIEAPMGFRARFFEYLPYRELVKEYFRKGAKWTAAPKPSMSDALYVKNYSTENRRFHADDHPALTDFEPCFDAASFARCGRDLFYQPDLVTNDFGAAWLERHLGPEYRVHRVRFDDTHPPQHIDATMVPLRPGLVLVNPERPAIGDDMRIFSDNGWEIVPAVPSIAPKHFPSPEVSNWISMNVFNIDDRTIIAEEQEMPTIKLLESLGFRVLAVPFTSVYSFGGSFHCCTLDIRRRGELKCYFPHQLQHTGRDLKESQCVRVYRSTEPTTS
jgi:glycine amidinotransferase